MSYYTLLESDKETFTVHGCSTLKGDLKDEVRGQIMLGDDGFYYFTPVQGESFSAGELRAISKILSKMNVEVEPVLR